MEKVDVLKSKFLDLIQRNAKIPIVGHLPDYQDQHVLQDKFTEELSTNPVPERPSDQEILETIDQKYFYNDAEFDAGRYELSKFEDVTNVEKIEVLLVGLKQQQLVVSNKVLQMILEKQSMCQDEFQNVCDVEKCIDSALENVRESRSNLETATRYFTTTSLGILANYRKRTVAQQLLRYLKTIKTLHETELGMQDLLKSGKFFKAVGLLLECRQVAAKYKHFTCVDALDAKLQDTLEMAEEHLDTALSTMCVEYDPSIYEELQMAYTLLGKTEVAIDQLHMHFISAAHKMSCFVVQSYTIIEASSSNDEKLYSQMCTEITGEHFIPCLLSLCKALWKIVLSYHQIVTWHARNPPDTKTDGFEAQHNEQYVKNKLNNGLAKLWQDMQTKVSSLVLAANLSYYKIDDFLEVLSILHRFSEIGEELCGSESKEVADSVRTQSICYFNKFHAEKLDELKVFLENESWTPCPVRSDFNCLLLQEFRGLRSSVELCAGVSSHHNRSVDGSSTGANFFARFPDPRGPTPFDISFHPHTRDENIIYHQEADDYSEDSDGDADAPHGGHKNATNPNKCPLLSNTTVSVLRLCGRYLQMSRLLRSISVEVVSALTQLFEYYLYTVHRFFASDPPNTLCPNTSSLKLMSVVKRIKENLLHSGSQDLDVTVDEALVSPMVDLESPGNMFGLKERILSVEYLIFLAEQFEFLKPYLQQLLDTQGSSIHYLKQFYSQTISAASEMREPVYSCVAWRVVNTKQVLSMMTKVDWGVDSVMSQHSSYVDFICQELATFERLTREIKDTIGIPELAITELWDCIIRLVARLFVEGFAGAKNCTTAGKGQMLLDFADYNSKLVKLCPLRPIPYKEFVETYIKAYYESESNLENWIRDHVEYSKKQLLGLVNCVCTNKKTRQKLTSLVDEIGKEYSTINR